MERLGEREKEEASDKKTKARVDEDLSSLLSHAGGGMVVSLVVDTFEATDEATDNALFPMASLRVSITHGSLFYLSLLCSLSNRKLYTAYVTHTHTHILYYIILYYIILYYIIL